MKNIFILFTLITFSFGLELNKSITLLCVEDKSIGFNWQQKEWTQKNFRTKKYIVKKYNENECSAKRANKSSFLKWDDSRKTNLRYGCYKVYRHGTKPYRAAEACFESWKKIKSKFTMTDIQCENFILKPNGKFVTSTLPATSEGSKVSMSLSHGKCSEL
ncbi:hypothetical protein CRU96_12735 [Malaciobacter halophilus]|nr:hypothetical protein [Malaciobacter halophilus]RYA22484.1 hypothetical protein CRU96_12735 [Malaciobacter halophilus]